MHVPIEIICTVLACLLAVQTALQGWILKELVRVKERASVLETRMEDLHNDTQHIIKQKA